MNDVNRQPLNFEFELVLLGDLSFSFYSLKDARSDITGGVDPVKTGCTEVLDILIA